MQYLIDTNILIYASKGLIPELSEEKVSQIFTTSFNISVISEIELLGYKEMPQSHYFKLKEFIFFAKRHGLTEEVKHKAITIKRTISIKTPDSIIAATALIHNLTLVSRNTKNFSRVEQLNIYNPFENIPSSANG